MPTLTIQGTDLEYDENDVLTFDEGLIGLPQLRRMVIVSQTAIAPLLWLASVDGDGVALIIAEAHGIFPAYDPTVPPESGLNIMLEEDDNPVAFGIVLIVSEWQKSTVNLRAPIFVSMRSKHGAQVILPDNAYSVCEPLAMALAA